jgi:TrmH family RNA methyltransferase
VKIPMLGQADSLNVAAATTLLLFEAVRQRRAARVTGG